MLTVTDAAREKFLEVSKTEDRSGHGLRIRVHGGGSFRPDYELSFVAPGETRDDDRLVDAGEFKVHVDPESARFLEGATIDFVTTPTQSGFKIDAPNAGLPRPTGPVADRIRQVLADQVNPGIAAHGGRIELAALEGDVAYLLFGGGCQGCGMANVTLKEGVEKALLAEIPELKGVRDVTDHAAGTNPYYK
jgi:Fe/S biogenesis protein NfuA